MRPPWVQATLSAIGWESAGSVPVVWRAAGDCVELEAMLSVVGCVAGAMNVLLTSLKRRAFSTNSQKLEIPDQSSLGLGDPLWEGFCDKSTIKQLTAHITAPIGCELAQNGPSLDPKRRYRLSIPHKC